MEQKKSKTLVLSMTGLIVAFYIAITLYILFAIVEIDALENFIAGMIFEFIAFIMLCVVIFGKILLGNFETGYFIPLVMVTIVYVALVNVLNMFLVALIPSVVFVLIHLVLLFVYCFVAVPMFIMGKK